MAMALRQIEFDVVILKRDLDHGRLTRALKNFSRAAQQADWAMIYFAGHEIEVDGHNYLVPIDAGFLTHRDLEFEGVSLHHVVNVVEGARVLQLVVLDACRDNQVAHLMRSKNVTRSIVGRGLAMIEPDPGTLIVYAAKHGSTALDGHDAPNSPFTAAFVKYIVQPGIEVSKLFRLVRDHVKAATNHGQVPYEYGSLPAKDFFFVAHGRGDTQDANARLKAAEGVARLFLNEATRRGAIGRLKNLHQVRKLEALNHNPDRSRLAVRDISYIVEHLRWDGRRLYKSPD